MSLSLCISLSDEEYVCSVCLEATLFCLIFDSLTQQKEVGTS